MLTSLATNITTYFHTIDHHAMTIAAALVTSTASCMINQDAQHRRRSDCIETGSALQVNAVLVDEPHEGFVKPEP